MTEQKKKILESVRKIKEKIHFKFSPDIALITGENYTLPQGLKIIGKINLRDLFTDFENSAVNNGKFLFAKAGSRDIIILKGRYNYFEGISMRDIGHTVYTLRFLGVKKILSVDDVGHLNPRFTCGELALIYDHINLMGDNPLIGENDDTIGVRFPDMSNAYDRKLYGNLYKVFQDYKIRINESVYLGNIGPASETEAEARFFREIGSDVTGYSIVPENITSVHAGLKFSAVGLITRNLVADIMLEDSRTDNQKEKDEEISRKKAMNLLNKILLKILKTI